VLHEQVMDGSFVSPVESHIVYEILVIRGNHFGSVHGGQLRVIKGLLSIMMMDEWPKAKVTEFGKSLF